MRITSARPLPGYRLELRFDNGENGIVDLSEVVGIGVFAAWEKPGTFETVMVTTDGAVEWPGDIDMVSRFALPPDDGQKTEDLFPSLKSNCF